MPRDAVKPAKHGRDHCPGGEDPIPCLETSASSMYHLISAVGQNEHTILGSSALLTGYYICNIASAYRYVKLFNKATTPVVGTDTPAMTLGIPPITAANIGFESFPEFPLGLGIATVSGIADADITDVGINELAVNIFYMSA